MRCLSALNGLRCPQAKKPDPLEHVSAEGRAAMAAVDKAAEALPPQEDLKYSIFESDGAGFGQRPPDDPPNAGTKVKTPGHAHTLKVSQEMKQHLLGVGRSGLSAAQALRQSHGHGQSCFGACSPSA